MIGYLNNKNVSVAGYIEVNEWNGFIKPQMQMININLSKPILIDQRVNKLSKNDFTFENVDYIFYNKDVYDHALKFIPASSNAILLSSLEQAKAYKNTQEMIIVDCPYSINQFFETVSNNLEFPIRCYFYKENHLFLTGLPSRAEFAKVYKYLASHQNIDLKNEGHLLVQQLKMESQKIFLIVQVFLEANFVIISNGLLNTINDPKKVDLNETTNFQNAKLQMEAEELFLYSSFKEIVTIIKP